MKQVYRKCKITKYFRSLNISYIFYFTEDLQQLKAHPFLTAVLIIKPLVN